MEGARDAGSFGSPLLGPRRVALFLLIVLLSCGLAGWLFLFLWHALQTRGAVKLSGTMDFPLQSRPLVSILIPARNEAEILTATLPRFLAQDYGNFEVILVDDASTDATAGVAARLASSCPERFRLLRVDTLPPGWIGKPHALDMAFRAAQGEWVLAADADVLLHPKALRAGLWVAEQQGADLVSIFAFMECVSFWEKVVLPGFGLLLATFFPLRKVNDSGSTVALASGGYILMRRRVWENLGGYKNVRAEMIEDLHTARIVKHSGRRIFVALTRDLVRTRMYRNFGEVWEGLRKNAFAGHHFSIRRMLSWVGGACLATLLPVLGLLYSAALLLGNAGGIGEQAWQTQAVFTLCLAQYFLSGLLHLPVLAYYGISPGYALLAPVGGILYICISLDSMIRTLMGQGVSWKLRQYGKPPLESED